MPVCFVINFQCPKEKDMNIPTLDQIKQVIEAKGYTNPWACSYQPIGGAIHSGRIPVEFFYKIIHNKKVLAIAKEIFKEMNFVDDNTCNEERDCDYITRLNEAITSNNLLPGSEVKEFTPEQREMIDSKLSKLLFVAIRSKVFGGMFDDILVVCTRDGSIYKSFEGCSDLDFRRLHSFVEAQIFSETPICIKPGFYPDLFLARPYPRKDDTYITLTQNRDIDWYSISLDENKKYTYRRVYTNNYQLCIGKKSYGDSSPDILVGPYAFELKHYDDFEVFSNLLDVYLQKNYIDTDETMDIEGIRFRFIDNMTLMPYLLLEETDFEGVI